MAGLVMAHWEAGMVVVRAVVAMVEVERAAEKVGEEMEAGRGVAAMAAAKEGMVMEGEREVEAMEVAMEAAAMEAVTVVESGEVVEVEWVAVMAAEQAVVKAVAEKGEAWMVALEFAARNPRNPFRTDSKAPAFRTSWSQGREGVR